LHRNTPEGLFALKSGRTLLASQDPLIALFEKDGAVRWFHVSTTPTFGRSSEDTFEAARDGSVAAFDWGRGDPLRVVFDLAELSVRANTRPAPLVHAVTTSPRVTVDNWLGTSEPSVDGQRLDIERFEISRALSIAEDGRFLLGCEWSVYLYDAEGKRLWRHVTTGSARAAYLTPDARVAIVAFDNGMLRWLDGATGRELVTVAFNAPTHEWVAWTPEGFYSGTPLGEQLLGITVLHPNGSSDFEPLERFAALMRRPDIVKNALRRTSSPAGERQLAQTMP